jgi:predicted 3-demethylubiquinone-9 3-methyltransferase (glyoxalase superfamily)
MSKITPFLWFDDDAEKAARFYVSIFKDSKILNIARYPEGAPGQAGTVMTVEFQLEGQKFIALNGGPLFPFTEAISFSVSVESQAELDDLWYKLLAGGEESQCGWLKDQFGLSWQIVPTVLVTLLSGPDPVKAASVNAAMLKMKKLDIAALQRAAQ